MDDFQVGEILADLILILALWGFIDVTRRLFNVVLGR